MSLAGIGSILTGVSDVSNTVAGWYNSYQSNKMAKKNLQLEKDKFAYDKSIQQEIFNREDSAHQRAVADMRKAGLNPVLAAGAGAGSGGTISSKAPQGQAPQMPEVNFKSPEFLAHMLQMEKDFAVKDQQINLLKAQIDSTKAQADKTNHDLNWFKKLGLPTNYPMGSNFGVAYSVIDLMRKTAWPKKTEHPKPLKGQEIKKQEQKSYNTGVSG